jgi:hypothetical protein
MKAFSIHSLSISPDRPFFIQDGLPDLAAPIQVVVPGCDQLLASMAEDDVLLVQDRFPLKPTRRLVVLVPSGEVDETALARRIWQLAANSYFSVLYLALSPDTFQAAYQRRRLADLAAATSGKNVRASGSVSAEQSWREALKRVIKPGDLLICLANHTVTRYLAWRASLGKQMVETVGVPVFMLSGFKIGRTPQERQATKEVLSWIIFVVLLATFIGLQVSIVRSTTRPLSTTLLCLSVVVELYVLWKINDWIG